MFRETIFLTFLLVNLTLNNWVEGSSLQGKVTGTDSEPEGDDSIFDDRININRNQAHAHARNRDGSFSNSDSATLGINAGIVGPRGQYQNLGSQYQSQGNSFQGGRRPPSTYANTGSANRGSGFRGNAGSGFRGDSGNAWSNSQNNQIAIPIGFDGSVLLSNLQRPGSKGQDEEEVKTRTKKCLNPEIITTEWTTPPKKIKKSKLRPPVAQA